MPFDGLPSDYKVKKPDVFSLEGLIAWLETQDPRATYNWYSLQADDGCGCLLYQYLIARGACPSFDYAKLAECLGGRTLDIKVAMQEPWTYGAALTRARALSQGRD